MQEGIETVSKSGSFYEELADQVRATFATRMGAFGPHLFATKSNGLSSIYVTAFPEAEQQHHNCNCCRDFIRNYGHAVFVQPDGTTIPALWDHTGAPEEYRAAIKALEEEVGKAGVKGRFFTENNTWGRGETNGWTHFEVIPSLACTSLVPADAVGSFAGKSREGFELLEKALAYGVDVIREAANLFTTDRLNRSEGYKPMIMWLLGVAQRQAKLTSRAKRNALFLEVANVESEAWVKIANTVVGNLMEDIKAGMHTDSVVGRFNKLTAPETYQRVVAAPTAGNVAVAQKIFAELGLSEKDLGRRAARIEEIRALWKPTVVEVPVEEKPLFGSIKTKEAAATPAMRSHVAPAVAITYEKFAQKVLPQALSIEAYVPSGRLPFVNFVTALAEDAKPLFWYDTEADRNPLSWYNHVNGGTPAHGLNLQANTWTEVTAISALPAVWTGGERAAVYSGVAVILKGCKDMLKPASCLFPELLRGDLREARRVVETYSNDNLMQGLEEGSAAGLALGNVSLTLRVTTELGRADYVIDRME